MSLVGIRQAHRHKEEEEEAEYFGANAGIELAALQRTLTRPKPDLFFEQECQRLTETLLKREMIIKEIIESS